MFIYGYSTQRIAMILSCFAVALSLTACGGASGGSGVVNSAGNKAVDAVVDADMAILHAVYFDQRTPPGFYQLSAPATASSSGSYRLSHVKNTDILPPVDRANKPVYELSTNDYVEAMSWSEIAAKYQKVYRQFVNISDTDLYFQITRVDMNNPKVSYYDRIFKRSAIDRRGVDRSVPVSAQTTVYMGKISPATLSLARVKQLIEYLWAFSESNNFGNAVISTSIAENANNIVYHMKEAQLALSYSAQCDTVSIYDVDYLVDKSTGRINRTTVLSRQLSAKRNGAQVSLCY